MKVSKEVRKIISEVINHPYPALRLTPFIGDFTDQSKILIRELYYEGQLTDERHQELKTRIHQIERTEDPVLIDGFIQFAKSFL